MRNPHKVLDAQGFIVGVGSEKDCLRIVQNRHKYGKVGLRVEKV
jgi:hypothetical protein